MTNSGAKATETEIIRSEHDDTGSTAVKKSGLYGWDSAAMEWLRLGATSGGTLITGDSFTLGEYDSIVLGYNGTQVTTITYKLGANTVATLTLNYTGTVLDSVVKT